MAVVQNPVIGQARNQAGGMIFSKWKSLKTMRAKPLSVADPRTPAQQAVRRRTALLSSVMRAALSAIRIGYINFQDGTTQWAEFIKRNFASATADNGTSATINAAALQFSQGSLPSLLSVVIDTVVGQLITLEWVNNTGQGTAAGTDAVHVVMVNTNGTAVAAVVRAATRANEVVTVTAPAGIIASTARVFVFLSNEALTEVSDDILATT